jgi:GH15 family glucan-1,4-alpha-glucosidase
MPRDLVIGNGSLLIGFDSQYRLADFYFPHVGMENHAASRFRFGVWADGTLTWVEDAPWRKQLTYLRDTLVTDVTCENAEMGLRLRCYDTVDVDRNVYVRKIVVRNLRDERRTAKLFLHHDFNIYGNAIADTAFFDPQTGAIIHYKARRYFLINVDGGIAEYACGRSGIGPSEGTWRDAEDGELSMTPIAQGAVDSTIGVKVDVEAMASSTVLYWICAGRRYGEVRTLDRHVSSETPARVMARSASYWYTWVNKNGEQLTDLPDDIVDLYRRSQLIVSTQCDRGGAVIAANDSDIQWGHNDHYSYMWPRDAVFVCDAMDRAGYPEFAHRFLTFANAIIKDEGYFLHKYNADGSLASLWHPWVRDGKAQLPIQEDETALVVWLVARHYDRTRDLDFLRSIYDRLVIRIADFLYTFRDPETSLPKPSFDLWEERQGIFTFTACAVVAGLTAAAELANLFNDQERRERYTSAATAMREAIVEHLWLPDKKRFARGLLVDGELDPTIDASLFGTFYLGVFPPGSALVEGTMSAIREHLRVDTEVGGFARYPGDAYHRISEETSRVPGNPWVIVTLWIAEHAIASARNASDLHAALQHLFWVRSKALNSLVLPEQLNPYDGSPLSVAPLTWSHAQFVSAVRAYVAALEKWRIATSDVGAKNQLEFDRADPVDNH